MWLYGAMGKTPKRLLHCKICKSSFHSYTETSRDHLSHRTHRTRSKRCREQQAILRRLHLENNGTYDLDFGVDEFEDLDNDSGEEIDGDDGISDGGCHPGDEENSSCAKEDEEVEENFEECNNDDTSEDYNEDGDDDASLANSEDSYDWKRKNTTIIWMIQKK